MSINGLEQLSHGELLTLEQRVRHDGTGISPSMVIGRWQPRRLWSAGNTEASSLQALVLNLLGAQLLIENSPQDMEQPLLISNSVRLGPIVLRFSGPGWFTGRRPLLMFRFDQLQLSLSSWRLLQRQLPQPKANKTPFFALIAVTPCAWLLARGRGGGLALWRCVTN